jgi:hypothetical protein
VNTSVVGNGTISRSAQGALYPYAFPLKLTAIPLAGNYFAFWANGASGTNDPLAYVVTNADPTITAVFASLGTGQSTLTVIPMGDGEVTVAPWSTRYTVGQTATLTAVPDAGQEFIGWSGSATGAQNPLFVRMSQSKVITANFTQKARLTVDECFGQIGAQGFQILLNGQLGAVFRIDGSEDLVHWRPLATLSNAFGTVQFNDPFVTNITHRFYRASWVP